MFLCTEAHIEDIISGIWISAYWDEIGCIQDGMAIDWISAYQIRMFNIIKLFSLMLLGQLSSGGSEISFKLMAIYYPKMSKIFHLKGRWNLLSRDVENNTLWNIKT